MSTAKMKALGITPSQLKDIKCGCGSKNVDIGYFIKADEYHVTCHSCQKDGTGISWQSAADRLFPLASIKRSENEESIISSL